MALFDKAHSAKWEPSIDPAIPAWKRELILKKRAHGRSLPLGPGVGQPAADSTANEPWATGGSEARSKWLQQTNSAHLSVVHPKGYTSGLHGSGAKHKEWEAARPRANGADGHSLQRRAAARARSASVSSVPVPGRPCERPLRTKMVEEGAGEGQCAPSPSFSSFSDGFPFEYDASSSGDEEYEYGPGIVDRLRWKFINLTVREQDVTVGRPVRRVASLEHLLLDEGMVSDSCSKRKFGTVSGKAVAPSKVRKLDILMKKAYSMEALTAIDQLAPFGGKSRLDDKEPPNLLVNENVVIIEQPKRSRSSEFNSAPLILPRDFGRRHGSITIEEGELPPPDTVRTFKKIFERGAAKESRQSRIKSGIAAKIAVHKTLVAKAGQPVKKTTSAKVSWVEEASASGLLRQANNGSPRISSPRPDLEAKPLTNGNHRETKTDVEDTEPKMLGKKISVESLQRIREASEVNNYNFGSKLKSRDVHSTLPQSENSSLNNVGTSNRPRVVDIKPKTDEKPIGLIKPLPAAVPVEQKENLINQVKTAMAKSSSGTIGILNGTIDCNAPTDGGSSKIGLKKVNTAVPEPTTMVFNFTDKTDVKPKISNTQSSFSVQRPLVRIDKSSGKLVSNLFQGSEASAIVFIPGMTTTVSSDFDEEDDAVSSGEPILPCGIEFEGENVIVGRTCLLQKRNKQLKISFDDSSTATYEYPSEMVVLEEYEDETDEPKTTDNSMNLPSAEDTSSTLTTTATQSTGLMSTPALSSSGGLANYIPSKLSEGEKFELGVSRPTAAEPTTPTTSNTSSETNELDEMVIKPAGDEQASSWSSSQTSAADILF